MASFAMGGIGKVPRHNPTLCQGFRCPAFFPAPSVSWQFASPAPSTSFLCGSPVSLKASRCTTPPSPQLLRASAADKTTQKPKVNSIPFAAVAGIPPSNVDVKPQEPIIQQLLIQNRQLLQQLEQLTQKVEALSVRYTPPSGPTGGSVGTSTTATVTNSLPRTMPTNPARPLGEELDFSNAAVGTQRQLEAVIRTQLREYMYATADAQGDGAEDSDAAAAVPHMSEKDIDGFSRLYARFLIETRRGKREVHHESQGSGRNNVGYSKKASENGFHEDGQVGRTSEKDSEAAHWWSKISPPSADMLADYELLGHAFEDKSPAKVQRLLDKLVVLKLNGGLGTSMGCTGPKSAIEVRDDKTFMDIVVQQIDSLNRKYEADVPLLLMNSFHTDENTERIIQKYNNRGVSITRFNQSKYPRIKRDTLALLPPEYYQKSNNGKTEGEGWYPPGHGDVYASLFNSGLLDELLAQGKEYIFISNVDNLGATVDLAILNHMIENKKEFLIEVTNKTISDIKGGTLITYEGETKLLEVAQVPKEFIEEFKSVRKFRVFNTNSLWVNLRALKKVMEEADMAADLIVNRKTLRSGTDVIQLETAAGAYIQYFKGAQGVIVPRSRFLPVKTTSDLFVVQSNLYTLAEDGSLVMNPKRQFSFAPHVKLGDKYTTVESYMKRLGNIPNILELEHLTVSGDVTFGRDVTLSGTVIIVANPGNRIDIPSGAILENKVISGNLNILEH